MILTKDFCTLSTKKHNHISKELSTTGTALCFNRDLQRLTFFGQKVSDDQRTLQGSFRYIGAISIFIDFSYSVSNRYKMESFLTKYQCELCTEFSVI